jgi:hypothetical protein
VVTPPIHHPLTGGLGPVDGTTYFLHSDSGSGKCFQNSKMRTIDFLPKKPLKHIFTVDFLAFLRVFQLFAQFGAAVFFNFLLIKNLVTINGLP